MKDAPIMSDTQRHAHADELRSPRHRPTAEPLLDNWVDSLLEDDEHQAMDDAVDKALLDSLVERVLGPKPMAHHKPKQMEVHPTCRPDTYVQDEAPLSQSLGALLSEAMGS